MNESRIRTGCHGGFPGTRYYPGVREPIASGGFPSRPCECRHRQFRSNLPRARRFCGEEKFSYSTRPTIQKEDIPEQRLKKRTFASPSPTNNTDFFAWPNREADVLQDERKSGSIGQVHVVELDPSMLRPGCRRVVRRLQIAFRGQLGIVEDTFDSVHVLLVLSKLGNHFGWKERRSFLCSNSLYGPSKASAYRKPSSLKTVHQRTAKGVGTAGRTTEGVGQDHTDPGWVYVVAEASSEEANAEHEDVAEKVESKA